MRRLSVPGAKAALASALAFFVLVQAVYLGVVQRRHPEYLDPEYVARRRSERARQAEQPERPLLAFLGSSRGVMIFRPEEMADLPETNGVRPLPFNFAHIGGGPIANLMIYHRLRRDGIHPAWVVAEIMPTFLTGNVTSFPTTFMIADDLPVLAHHVELYKLGQRIALTWLVPFHRFRGELVRDHAPDWQTEPCKDGIEGVRLGSLGGDDHWWTKDAVGLEEASRRLEEARVNNAARLQHFVINERATRACDELLTECRRDGVPVLLVLLPEGETFRGWYSPEARATLDAWCRDLSRRHEVPIVDARCWLTDADFSDSHHALRRGGVAFSRRFGAEVLAPFVEGRLRGAGVRYPCRAGETSAEPGLP